MVEHPTAGRTSPSACFILPAPKGALMVFTGNFRILQSQLRQSIPRLLTDSLQEVPGVLGPQTAGETEAHLENQTLFPSFSWPRCRSVSQLCWPAIDSLKLSPRLCSQGFGKQPWIWEFMRS